MAQVDGARQRPPGWATATTHARRRFWQPPRHPAQDSDRAAWSARV